MHHARRTAQSEFEARGLRQRGEPPEVSMSIKRYWTRYHALGWLLEHQRAATSTEMEHIVGHLTFRVLVEREALSTQTYACDFVRTGYSRRGTVCQKCARGLLVLCRQRLDSKLSTTVTAFNACETSHPSVDAEMDARTMEVQG